MSKTNWQIVLAQTVAEIGHAQCLGVFDKYSVQALISRIAALESALPDYRKLGCERILQLAESGQETFIDRVYNSWKGPWEKQMSEPTPNPRKKQCVIAIRTSQVYSAQQIHDALSPHFADWPVTIHRVTHIHDLWYDLHVFYDAYIAQFWGELTRTEWIEDAVTKPASDFGKRTIATIR